MSVHERMWRAVEDGAAREISRKAEADELRARGLYIKPIKWAVAWREGTRQKSKTFTRERDAQRYDAEISRRLELGEPILRRRDVPTLEQLADRWFDQREQDVVDGSLALGTVSELAGLLDRYILPSLGHLHVIDLNAERLDDWIGQLRSSGTSPYRIRRSAGLVTRLLAYAVRLGYLQGNAGRELELPSHFYRRGRTATLEQVEKMRAWFLERDRLGDATLVSILAEGLRPAEALAASWSGFDGRRIHVASHLRDGAPIEGTKRGRRRTAGPARWVTLAEPHAVDLSEWRLALGRPHGLIFPRSSDGMGWRKYDQDNWRKRSFRPAAGAAGLLEWNEEEKTWEGDFIPYDLRHTCASSMIAAGRPITEVAEHLGHGADVLMGTYSHLIKERQGQPLVPIDDAIRIARSSVFGGAGVVRELREGAG